MKRKPWITTFSSLAVASLILVASPANASGNANSYGSSRAVFDYVDVLSVAPVIRYVTVTTPVNANLVRAGGMFARPIMKED